MALISLCTRYIRAATIRFVSIFRIAKSVIHSVFYVSLQICVQQVNLLVDIGIDFDTPDEYELDHHLFALHLRVHVHVHWFPC